MNETIRESLRSGAPGRIPLGRLVSGTKHILWSRAFRLWTGGLGFRPCPNMKARPTVGGIGAKRSPLVAPIGCEV